MTTIQLWTAKIPRQRTVRAAKTRTKASGCSAGDGKRPALERSADCQSTERSPNKYFTDETVIGATGNGIPVQGESGKGFLAIGSLVVTKHAKVGKTTGPHGSFWLVVHLNPPTG